MPGNEHRPGQGTGAAETFGGVVSSIPQATDADRCTRCGHPITARLSVRLGMGPICRRVWAQHALACLEVGAC